MTYQSNAYFGFSIYVSTDTGKTFTKTATLGNSRAVNQIRVHPTVAGDVWATTDSGLFHSLDYGKTFAQISSGVVTAGWSFGKFIPHL
jgi:xyloglucan-specific exo-beta-1,4-glucanase